MDIEDKTHAILAAMPLPIPDNEHKRNAEIVASYAPDLLALNMWERDGADEDDPQEVEVVAVAYLPDERRALLARIAAAGDEEKDGNVRYSKRVEYARQTDPTDLRVLVAWMSTIIDCLEDGDDDDGGNNGTPALRPRPRRKGHGFGMG